MSPRTQVPHIPSLAWSLGCFPHDGKIIITVPYIPSRHKIVQERGSSLVIRNAFPEVLRQIALMALSPELSLARGLHYVWRRLFKTHCLVPGRAKTSSKHMAIWRKKDKWKKPQGFVKKEEGASSRVFCLPSPENLWFLAYSSYMSCLCSSACLELIR